MSDISVIFDADTGRFRASVDAATQTVTKASEAVAAAKNKILDSFNSQVDAATKVGVSASRLSDIQTKAAQSMASVTDANATKIINSLDRISARQKAVAAELGALKVPHVADVSDITDRMRASALIRGGGLRASENFASQFELFNKIATIAFPVLGLVTLTEQAVKFGKELYTAFDLGGERARQTAMEIESVDNSLRDSNTSLDVQIDKLQQEQAQLEKKPFNGIKLALDEAAEASENLQKKLNSVLETELKVIQGMTASSMQQMFSGGSDTHQEQVMVQEHMRWLNRAPDINGQQSENTSFGKALQIRLAELQKKAKENAEATAEGSKMGIGGVPLNSYKEEIAAVQELMSWQQDERESIKKTIELQQQEGKTQHARDTHSSGMIDNKANAQRLKAMEDFANVWPTLAPVSAKAIFDYWTVQREAFAKGSSDATTQIDAIDAKLKSIVEEGARSAHEAIQKLRASMQDKLELPRTDGNVMGNNTASSRALNAEYGKSNLEGDLLTAEAAKAKVAIDLADGSIDKLTADQRLAAIAATEHAARLADLNKQIADLKNSSGSYNSVLDRFGSDKDQQQYVGLNSQVTKENSAASIEAMQSAAKVAGDTWSSALKDANAKWVQDSQDSAQQVVALYRQAIDGLNKSLIDLMNGKNSFANYFKGIGNTLANDGLRRAESGIMNGLGIGKPDGSAANPLHVIMAGGSTVGGAVGSAASSIGSGIGNFFMGLFGGARALGGDVSVGHVYRINEQGQELFAPSVSGKMLPHSSTGTTGNGTVYYNVEVANGVTPTQMRMHVQEALKQYHPYGVSAAVAAVSERRQRTASSAK